MVRGGCSGKREKKTVSGPWPGAGTAESPNQCWETVGGYATEIRVGRAGTHCGFNFLLQRGHSRGGDSHPNYPNQEDQHPCDFDGPVASVDDTQDSSAANVPIKNHRNNW